MVFAGGGRLEIRFTPADVGKRVSVRRVVEIADGRPVFTDTVGVLTSWEGGVLIVTRRDGQAVHIAESTLAAGKVVPDAPVRRGGRAAATTVDVPELARVAARAWPPVESERIGDWELRASGGFTRRANSALALGDPGLPLDDALRRVVAWYTRRGLPPFIQVITGSDTAAELTALRWPVDGAALVRTAALAPVADCADPGGVVLSREVAPEWLNRYHRSGGSGADETADRTADEMKVLGGGPSVWFATVAGTEGGAPAAIGRCVIDGRWAGFMAIEVDPQRRRQGLASAVMAALAQQALAEGASVAYLQVETDNDGAHALYDRLGFITRYGYHFHRAPLGDNG